MSNQIRLWHIMCDEERSSKLASDEYIRCDVCGAVCKSSSVQPSLYDDPSKNNPRNDRKNNHLMVCKSCRRIFKMHLA